MYAIRNTLMNHEDQIQRLHAICDELDLARLYALVEQGTLDDYYQALTAGIEWLNRLAALNPRMKSITPARQRFEGKCAAIRRFYQKYFSTHRVLGDAQAAEHPDIVFILACKDIKVMRQRVEGTLPAIQGNPDARIVLCGGGFDPSTTEADVMRKVLVEHGLSDRDIVTESDSIDTVANAVFAKLRLRMEDKLPNEGNLLVATSAFHATRSLNIFRRVFGPEYRIAALPVKMTTADTETERLAAHELRTEERSTREIFGMTDFLTGMTENVDADDEVTLFYQLVLHHDFYRHRYDLLRAYAPVLNQPAGPAIVRSVDDAARWAFAFVPMGADLKGRVDEQSVALDVGNGEPEDGILDHHHRTGRYACAAEMVKAYRNLIVDRLADVPKRRVILHANPDLDCIVSAALAWAYVESENPRVRNELETLVDVCSRADQGRIKPERELNVYTLTLMLPLWLNSDEGQESVKAVESDITELAAQRGWRWRASGDRSERVATIALLLVLYWCEGNAANVCGTFDAGMFPMPLRPIIEGVANLLQEGMTECEEEWERIQHNDWTGSLMVPCRDGSVTKGHFVRVVDPKANPSLLGKYLWSSSTEGKAGQNVVLIQSTVENRTVISVDPDSGLSLKGLGLALQRREAEREKAAGIPDTGPARYRYRGLGGSDRIDPLFSSSDPWYDGRGHGFTIVDTPGAGSLMTLDEVVDVLIHEDWQSLGRLYESEEYLQWLARRA